jgi:ABC-type glucose/galactose transport system permease subunit
MMRVNPYLQEIAYGALIVLAVAISSIRYYRIASKM